MKEIIKSNEAVYRGDFLTVDRVRVELPDGREGIRDIVRHPGAVAILAINDADEILLDRNRNRAIQPRLQRAGDVFVRPGVEPRCEHRTADGERL